MRECEDGSKLRRGAERGESEDKTRKPYVNKKIICYNVASESWTKNNSDTGNRTPGYRVRGDNVSHYTISDMSIGASHVKMSEGANGTEATRVPTFQK